MSSAPPGWHLQPDGRERFWDGERWTDEFRDPASAPTQEIPTDRTRGIPTDNRGGTPGASPMDGPAGGRFDDRYEEYYQPGGPLSDRPDGGTPGWLKGCGIVLVTLLVIAVLGLAGAWWLFNRDGDSAPTSSPEGTVETTEPAEETEESAPEETSEPTPTEEDPEDSTVPTDWPSGFPTELPTGLPTGLPTNLPTMPGLPGAGAEAEAAPGDAFSLGPAEIQQGWTVTARFGLRTVSMSAVATESSALPLVFSLTFFQGDTELAETMCTTFVTTIGEETSVACVPMRGAAESADRVRAAGPEE